MASDKVLFSETQRFRQWWILAILGVITTATVAAFVMQIVLGNDFGSNPAPDILVIVLLLVFGLGLPAFILSLKLETQVVRDEVRVRLWPIHWGWIQIPLDSITEAGAVTYSPLKDYGGWGIRFGPKGKAYNAYGNRGLRLVHGGGQRLLIGSQRPDEFERALVTAGRSRR